VDLDAKHPRNIPKWANQLNEFAAAYYGRFSQPGPDPGHTSIGGHENSIVFEGAVVWKRDQGGSKGQAEFDFLRAALEDGRWAGIVPSLVGYRERDGGRWIGMSNVLAPFRQPAILDIKIGTRTWNSLAGADKVESQSRKAGKTTTNALGLRVVGGRVRAAGGDFALVGSKHGRPVGDEGELRALLAGFLRSDGLRASALRRLAEISGWWTEQASFAFYASSLLLAYDTVRLDDCAVTLIDFANCERITTKAEDLSGYEVGLATLKRVIESLAPIS